MTPDYCLGLGCPGKDVWEEGRNSDHTLTPFSLGRICGGVTLGQGCPNELHQTWWEGTDSIEEVYAWWLVKVLGTAWKHGISKLSSKNLVVSQLSRLESTGNAEITNMGTKAVSDAFQTRWEESGRRRLQERRRTKNFRPQLSGKRLTNAELTSLKDRRIILPWLPSLRLILDFRIEYTQSQVLKTGLLNYNQYNFFLFI